MLKVKSCIDIYETVNGFFSKRKTRSIILARM